MNAKAPLQINDDTATFLIKSCGLGYFNILSIGPTDVDGVIGTKYHISVSTKTEPFDKAYVGTWPEREKIFRSDFLVWLSSAS